MHGTAAPVAIAVPETEDFAQRPLNRRLHGLGQRAAQGVETFRANVIQGFGQELMMRAVGAVDLVVLAQPGHATDRRPFLPDRRVGRSVHQCLARQLQDKLLEGADEIEVMEDAQ